MKLVSIIFGPPIATSDEELNHYLLVLNVVVVDVRLISLFV